MTKPITPFDVVLVPFPFSNLEEIKRRPCLVLANVKPSRYSEHLIVAMMTSHLERHFPHDVVVQNYEEAGLPKPTLIRLAKVVTLELGSVRRKLGTLTPSDRKSVIREWKALFQKFF